MGGQIKEIKSVLPDDTVGAHFGNLRVAVDRSLCLAMDFAAVSYLENPQSGALQIIRALDSPLDLAVMSARN
jgi:hypothetical protein